MREVVYYLTQSVDGFIADVDGKVGWMSGSPNEDYGYEKFYHSVGTILLGSHTYEHILGIEGNFPYPDKEVVVYSHRDLEAVEPNILIERGDAAESVARLKLKEGGSIWLGGGAELATSLLDAGLVDRIRVFLQPILLGNGIGLTDVLQRYKTLELTHTKEWIGGIVELEYTIVKPWRSDV
ncbi:MAG: dihydrofolate reductase family protein [Coriobacteriia bacterium]|nr:dihydrofolate reductase family protein [Coriobacteriia bacterium]